MQDIIIYIAVLCGSGFTMFILTYSIFWLFRRWGIVDKPHLYPHEEGRGPLPYPGGIVLIINLLLWSPWILQSVSEGDVKKSIYVLLAGLLTSLIMAWDDQKRSLHPLFRLIFQIALWAFFGLTAIKIGYVSNIFGGIISLDTFEALQWTIGTKTIYLIPLVATIIWYVLVMNAINWSDNGRAMTSSVSLVTLVILAGLSLKLYLTDTTIASQNNSLFVLSFLTILIPTLFVFWRFDVRRACIVGDAGSMFLGFMIATLSIVSGGKIATASIVLGIYFIDAFYVILGRIRAGKNPMKWDLTHLHHRMAEQGIDYRHQRYIVMILSFFFGVGAIFLDTWWKIILFGSIITIVIYISQIAKTLETMMRKDK